MKQLQIVVSKAHNQLWFTAQWRRFGFWPFRGRWNDINPTHNPTFEEAVKTARDVGLKNMV